MRCLTAAVVVCCLAVGPAFAEPGEEHDHGHGHAPKGPPTAEEVFNKALSGGFQRKAAANPPAAFARYTNSLVDLCTGLARDGRRDRLVALATKFFQFEPGCAGCRPFYKLVLQCCEKSARLEARAAELALTPPAEGEPPATPMPPRPPEIDPHPVVIDALSRIFGTMVEYESELPEAYKVIKKLLTGIETATYTDPREKSYYMVIHEYIEAPFRPYLRELAEKEHAKATPTPDGAVDEFFE